MTDARVAQVAREVLRDGDGKVRVAQVARETLRDGQGRVRVAQIAREVLRDGDPSVRVSQVSRQVLQAAEGRVRVAQVSRQVLRSRRDSPYPHFPVRLFCPPSLSARLEGGALTGGEALSGDQAVEAMTSGAKWVMAFGEAPLWEREQLMAWRSFATACDNGVMPAIVPLWDRKFQPFVTPAYTGDSTFAQVVWRDTPDSGVHEIVATCTVEAERYARQVSFSVSGAAELTGGIHFSIYGPRYGWRLYRLIRPLGDGAWEIRPPLREWLGVGEALDFNTPRCTMRPAGDLAEMLELLRLGKGAATFVESFERYP